MIRDVQQTLKLIFARECDVPLESITPETCLGKDLKVDSLDYFQIIIAIEGEFGLQLKLEDLPKERSLRNFEEFITNRLQCS